MPTNLPVSHPTSSSVDLAQPAHEYNSNPDFDNLDNWTFEFSPDHQLQLQNVLTTNWPFDFNSRGSLGLNSFDASAPIAEGGYDHFWLPPVSQEQV